MTTVDANEVVLGIESLGDDDALGGGAAHLAGSASAGWSPRWPRSTIRGAFSALTLVGTRAVAPGRPDDDLPDHDRATMRRLLAAEARLD
jgi:hypothetical protein